MARKGVRKKESEGFRVRRGVHTYLVITGCANPPAVGDVQKTVCVNSSSHVDEAFSIEKDSLVISDLFTTSPVPFGFERRSKEVNGS
jgi:hypothetical protein